jgi:predicted secreted protein
MRRIRWFWLANWATSSFLLASPAGAQNVIRSDCLPYIAAMSKLTYDQGDHKKWYRHYWEGKCKGFWLWQCTTSEKGWNERMDALLNAAVTAQEKQQVLQAACKQGELVGYEWAKDNHKRCIQTERSQNATKNLEILREILLNTSLKPLERLRATAAKFREWCPNVKPPKPHS